MDLPSFSKATLQLKDFLISQGYNSEVLWTFFEDYAWVNNILYVRAQLPLNNSKYIEFLYNSTNARHFGVEFRVVSIINAIAYCAIYVPTSLIEADERLINGLKLNIPSKMPNSQVVSSNLKWIWLKLRESSPSIVQDIHHSKGIQLYFLA